MTVARATLTRDTVRDTLVARMRAVIIDPRGILAQPSSSSVLAFTSDSGSDTGDVVIAGTSGGTAKTETITLTGVSTKNTTNAYTLTTSIISKSTPVGTITATSNSGVVTVVTLTSDFKIRNRWRRSTAGDDFIFSSEPDFSKSSLPIIFAQDGRRTSVAVAIGNSAMEHRMDFRIMVVARNVKERDMLADDVMNNWQTDSAPAGYYTALGMTESEIRNVENLKDKRDHIIQKKKITVRFKFVG